MLPITKILWPTDFSEPSYEALKVADEMALHFSAELIITHVVTPIPVIPIHDDPTSFNLDEAIFILAAVLIGGTGNTRGPIAGAVFVVLLPELLRFVGLPDAVAANLRQIIYGLSLILLMRWRPQGIAGNYQVS